MLYIMGIETAFYNLEVCVFGYPTITSHRSVSIETRLQAGQPVFSSWKGQWWDFFCLCHYIQTASGAHPTSYPTGSGGSSGREADNSPPSGAGVKNAWSYTSTPQYMFTMWCLISNGNDMILS